MNGLATAGVVGATIGLGKGVIDQKNAQKYDQQAGTDISDYALNGIRNAGTIGLMAMGGYAGVSKLLGKEFTIKGNNIKEIAQSISKNVYPGKEQLSKELSETIANNSKLFNSLYTENIQKSLSSMFQGINIPEEEAIKMAKTVNGKNYEKAIDNLAESISKHTDKPVDKVIERAKAVTEKELNKAIDTDMMSIPEKIMKYPQAYFSNPDKTVRNTRIGAAVGTYAAVSVGGRYLQGGTLTTDQYGRKDIAGIPFL